MSRGAFLKLLALGAGAVVVGCSPVKILLKAYPERFKHDEALRDRILRAFATAVVPGAPGDAPNLVRIFTDRAYPFAAYCDFFVADLAARARSLHGTDDFASLSLAQRTAVIQDGLNGDAVAAKLYRGAIFMTQVSFFGAIYDDERGCAMIEYDGVGAMVSTADMTYSDPARFLARACTATGNFN